MSAVAALSIEALYVVLDQLMAIARDPQHHLCGVALFVTSMIPESTPDTELLQRWSELLRAYHELDRMTRLVGRGARALDEANALASRIDLVSALQVTAVGSGDLSPGMLAVLCAEGSPASVDALAAFAERARLCGRITGLRVLASVRAHAGSRDAETILDWAAEMSIEPVAVSETQLRESPELFDGCMITVETAYRNEFEAIRLAGAWVNGAREVPSGWVRATGMWRCSALDGYGHMGGSYSGFQVTEMVPITPHPGGVIDSPQKVDPSVNYTIARVTGTALITPHGTWIHGLWLRSFLYMGGFRASSDEAILQDVDAAGLLEVEPGWPQFSAFEVTRSETRPVPVIDVDSLDTPAAPTQMLRVRGVLTVGRGGRDTFDGVSCRLKNGQPPVDIQSRLQEAGGSLEVVAEGFMAGDVFHVVAAR